MKFKIKYLPQNEILNYKEYIDLYYQTVLFKYSVKNINKNEI